MAVYKRGETTKRARKGDGSAYQRGGSWWIRYTDGRGKQVREPGGLDGRGARTKTEAEEKLRQRLAEIRMDCYAGPAAERATVAELLDSYEAHLETRGAGSLSSVRSRAELHLRPYFGHLRALDVSTDKLREFTADRRKKYKPASVNRCLQDLRAAFHLARKEGRLIRVPYFPLLSEKGNVRRGFFERSEFETVEANLPDPERDVARFGYLTGWRLGEVLPLTWENVDRDAGQVLLWKTKNGEPRSMPLDDELRALIEKRWTARVYQRRDGTAAVSPFVFHVAGRRLWKLRGWHEACAAAEVPGKLFHDFRRTAARDLIRAGVPQAVAQTMTGHKTGAVFDRYNITSPEDKRDARERLRAYRAARPAVSKVSRL